jgi:hypothetical protein
MTPAALSQQPRATSEAKVSTPSFPAKLPSACGGNCEPLRAICYSSRTRLEALTAIPEPLLKQLNLVNMHVVVT